jgi:hypothetical protein
VEVQPHRQSPRREQALGPPLAPALAPEQGLLEVLQEAQGLGLDLGLARTRL